jgi:hypothetical protein
VGQFSIDLCNEGRTGKAVIKGCIKHVNVSEYYKIYTNIKSIQTPSMSMAARPSSHSRESVRKAYMVRAVGKSAAEAKIPELRTRRPIFEKKNGPFLLFHRLFCCCC